jgi:hypothetical protein
MLLVLVISLLGAGVAFTALIGLLAHLLQG